MSIVAEFVGQVQSTYKTHKATEHSYRPALKALFDRLKPGEVVATNEPKRIACGAPDFILQRDEIAIGFVEAKDVGLNLRALKETNRAQQQRYLAALPNLVYTNCIDWDFYKNGQLTASVSIADYSKGIIPKPEQYAALENLLKDFIAQRPQTISSPKVLAEIMAGKASLIKDVLNNALKADENLASDLADQFKAFREHLIHDITPEDFADIYAETIAYGMFAARLHDPTLATFNRTEALEYLPKSNPFLRNLFSYIAGPGLDDRIKWIIDDLAKAFQAANVQKIMEGFGKLTGQSDPFLHFYETFLAAYNPAKRKARGVWYTPEPIVNFIVRAVDDVLCEEFGLVDGLSDTSKVAINWDTGQSDKKGKPIKIKKQVHRVQVLDPSTGTGTFLAEVIKQIAPKVKGVAAGMWSQYVERDLIPRVHGLELLMASYAMCHMKLDMILTEMGYIPTGAPTRLSVYLTNSLEEGDPVNQSLPFAQWLSNEVRQANTIKRDMPIMCVIGNPPYSGISQNSGEWITKLIDTYKYIDGVHFEEQKHWLHDDYVKFIRFSQFLIEKNGDGVLGFVTNHGYLSNPTFRAMRWSLLKAFDQIHVIDLHGNANKREVAPNGQADKNVFDIKQGVSIIIAIRKTGSHDRHASVFHTDVWGDRQSKYDWLWKSKLKQESAIKLTPVAPYFMFYKVDLKALEAYDKGFSIDKMFTNSCTGIITARDDVAIAYSKSELSDVLKRLLDPSVPLDQIRQELFGSKKDGKYLAGDSRGWRMQDKIPTLRAKNLEATFRPILYRPFDVRVICYDEDLVDWPRLDLMGEFRSGENFALLSPRMTNDDFSPLVSSEIISNKTGSRYDQSYFFPIYVYPEKGTIEQERRSNLDQALSKKLRELASSQIHGEPDDVAIFDYIYGVLHCPEYREAYAEFLKIDFPRIPWPKSAETFWDVSLKGNKLRRLHLMEPEVVGQAVYPFEGEGDATVQTPRFSEAKIWINKTQYFSGIPESSWNFVVGGYQPAQKWLKDRKGRQLSFEEVKHYQKIIQVLAETDKIMNTINC